MLNLLIDSFQVIIEKFDENIDRNIDSLKSIICKVLEVDENLSNQMIHEVIDLLSESNKYKSSYKNFISEIMVELSGYGFNCEEKSNSLATLFKILDNSKVAFSWAFEIPEDLPGFATLVMLDSKYGYENLFDRGIKEFINSHSKSNVNLSIEYVLSDSFEDLEMPPSSCDRISYLISFIDDEDLAEELEEYKAEQVENHIMKEFNQKRKAGGDFDEIFIEAVEAGHSLGDPLILYEVFDVLFDDIYDWKEYLELQTCDKCFDFLDTLDSNDGEVISECLNINIRYAVEEIINGCLKKKDYEKLEQFIDDSIKLTNFKSFARTYFDRFRIELLYKEVYVPSGIISKLLNLIETMKKMKIYAFQADEYYKYFNYIRIRSILIGEEDSDLKEYFGFIESSESYTYVFNKIIQDIRKCYRGDGYLNVIAKEHLVSVIELFSEIDIELKAKKTTVDCINLITFSLIDDCDNELLKALLKEIDENVIIEAIYKHLRSELKNYKIKSDAVCKVLVNWIHSNIDLIEKRGTQTLLKSIQV